MKIKIKKSVLSSKKYNINIRNKFKNKIKRQSKKKKSKPIYLATIQQSSFVKKPTKIIPTPAKVEFPNDINKITRYLYDIQRCKNHKLIIDHRNMKEIDNVSILLMTAGISNIFNDKKLKKHKKYIPNKHIDERLAAIGYWNALCVGDNIKDNLDYLRITSDSKETIDNELHANIVNFFAKKDEIIMAYKDELFDAIYEAMANAKEHAYKGTDKKIWLLGSYNKREIEFVFYDIGQGIFESLAENTTKFGKILRRFSGIFGKNRTLERLCTTNLSKYKNQGERGLGMMAFKDFVDIVEKSGSYEALLEVTTSNLMFSSKNGTTKINQSIHGTLIRWVIRSKT